MIHDTWHNAPYISIDPECPKLHLEMPLRIGPFASIGFPGFGYEEGEIWTPKPHPYGVVILEGAALHSHVTIDRGSWRDTFIGINARLNNYSHIGHNVKMGDNVLVGVGVKIAGSTEIGDNVELWNGAIVASRCKIHEGAIIGTGSLVLRKTEIPTQQVWVGNPAKFLRMRREKE